MGIFQRIERHVDMEEELRNLKRNLKEVEKRREDLTDSARGQISVKQAQQLILDRFRSELCKSFDAYVFRYIDQVVSGCEHLWDKYFVSLVTILKKRGKVSEKIDGFMAELGYGYFKKNVL